MSLTCKWTWNTYQSLYNRAINIIKKNMTMTFYNEKEQLYIETDALGAGLGACLWQAMDGMWFPRNEAYDNVALQIIAFMSKSLTTAETHSSNTEGETIGILHDLENFHHYWFTCDISMITDDKLLVAVLNPTALIATNSAQMFNHYRHLRATTAINLN